MLVAAIQSMAWGRASGAHTAYTGRYVTQNSISGSLPTEIGMLSSLVILYGPLLCWGLWYTFVALVGACALCW